ncbi:acyltransferase family protein [Hymenobacter caeli]|uniref:Peptidoglycan/LPS O-acetylase OafA/YrhL n=1 Tax=Hymenobacter caeli TaxID=2735894 RepID=A0ABX2FT43_9BACT|nr:acyltransferase [Hymenobacter caeli]NRT20137.1 peptidoglycan/LPS O-acetylase OafA/YrhL [Hymenobacter caeli]
MADTVPFAPAIADYTVPGSLPSGYRPALNGVRALAVWLVVLGHWTLAPFPVGEMGRLTFFVLSGYLISGIAWKQGLYQGPPGRWGGPLRTFYLRRALRIIPPYYLALALGALLPLATLREYPAWFLLPVSNLLFYRMHHWGEGVGHYWTMAVDEQFYLLWPPLLFLLGKRNAWLLALAGASLVFRIVWSAHDGPDFVLVLLPASLDLFALGAVLKLIERRPRAHRLARGQWAALAWALWVGLWLLTHLTNHHYLWLLVYPSVGGVAAFVTLNWVLNLPVRTPRRPSLLLHPALQWLGQRSYGCYLYHLLLPVFYQRAVYHVVADEHLRARLLGPLPTVLVLTPLLLLLAAASWAWLEAPLDRLKHRISYPPASAGN